MIEFQEIVNKCFHEVSFSRDSYKVLAELAKAVAEYEKAKAIKELAEAVKFYARNN